MGAGITWFEWMRLNWTWVLSFATVIIGAGAYLFTRLFAVEKGVQALLRAQMIEYYNHYEEKGYAPLYARESFENCWIQYERLGKNGVMKDIRSKFLALPTHDEDKESKEV